MEIPFAHLLTLYFILLGPLKVFGIYGQATAHADRALKFQIANTAVGLSTIVAVLLALLGGFLMTRFEIRFGTLAIIMGLFLANWAYGRSMGIPAKTESIPDPENPNKLLAITPIALPGILPPQGVALLILSSGMVIEAGGMGQGGMLMVIGLIVGVMAINWVFFIFTEALMKFPGRLFWMLLSRSLGVVAAALSLQIMLFGLRDLGILN